VIFDVQEKYSKTSKKMAREKGIRAPASRDPSASEQRSERQRAEIRAPASRDPRSERQRAENRAPASRDPIHIAVAFGAFDVCCAKIF